MPEAAIDGDHSVPVGFSLGLSRAERPIFLLLAAGHLLFVVALFTMARFIGENALYVLAPLFGLPLALLGPRHRRAARALVLLPGFALVHYGAVFCAVQSVPVPFMHAGLSDSPWVPGAIGGSIGSAGSFALCALAGLVRAERRMLAAIAVAVLAAVGALGVRLLLGQIVGGADSDLQPIPYLFVYTPWQLAFAYFLARTLRS